MSKVSIIIGLPGSGKTTLINKLNSPEGDILMSDYGWKNNIDSEGNIDNSFNEEYRFDNLINFIKNSKNVLLESSYFCNHKFLCEAEYYLNLHFPNIEIEKFYFENNPEGSAANVLYREFVGGNHWKMVDGNLIFYGHHYSEEGPNKGKRMYEVITDNINIFSKNYIIPSKFTPLKIQVQDERFYKGWEELIRE